MAENTTQFALLVHCPKDQAARLYEVIRFLEEREEQPQTLLDPDVARYFEKPGQSPEAVLLSLFDDPDFKLGIDCGYDQSFEWLTVFDLNGRPNIDAFNAIFQRIFPEHLPFGYEIAYGCDHPIAGSFGGASVALGADIILMRSTSEMLEKDLNTLDKADDSRIVQSIFAEHPAATQTDETQGARDEL